MFACMPCYRLLPNGRVHAMAPPLAIPPRHTADSAGGLARLGTRLPAAHGCAAQAVDAKKGMRTALSLAPSVDCERAAPARAKPPGGLRAAVGSHGSCAPCHSACRCLARCRRGGEDGRPVGRIPPPPGAALHRREGALLTACALTGQSPATLGSCLL